MKKYPVFICLVIAGFGFFATQAQTIVENFQEPLLKRAANIQCIRVLPNGKALVGGNISFHGDTRVHELIRLNIDGSLDDTFSTNFPDTVLVTDLELLSTGEIIAVLRRYEFVRDIIYPESFILKLSQNGAVQATLSTLENVTSLAVQADNKILVNGSDQSGAAFLFRFNADFTADTNFNDAVSLDGGVNDIEVFGQSIFISGQFTSVNDVPKNDIVKLTLAGAVDNSFDVGDGSDDFVRSLTIQPDGKILIGGSYINSFNGQQFGGTVRLNVDGTIDQSFHAPTLNGPASQFYLHAGSIYVAAFLHLNGQTKDRLFKLSADGSLDETFTPVLLDNFGGAFLTIDFQNEAVLVPNTQFSGNEFGLSRYDLTGTIDDTYNPEIARFGTVLNGDLSSGKLIISGDFIRVNNKTTYGIARLTTDGILDESFQFLEQRGIVRQLKIVDENNILATTGPNFFKLNETGAVQNDFSFQSFGTLHQVVKLRLQDDKRIIAGDYNNVYRLNENGSQDNSFNIGTGICCVVSTLFDFDLRSGKIVYGSSFSQFNGTPVTRMVRLNSDASVDETFDVGAGPSNTVSFIKVLDNGEILVGGTFLKFDNQDIPYRLVKLSANGELDLEFNENQQNSPLPLEPFWSNVKAEQLGNKIYFRKPTSVYVINLDGTVDSEFKIPRNISVLSDIILVGNSSTGRIAETSGDMYIMGRFRSTETNDPSLLMKLRIESETTITGHEDEVEQHSLSVYPNPARDVIRVVTSMDRYELSIYSMSGAKVCTYPNNKTPLGDNSISIKDLTPGMYMLRIVSSDNGKAVTKKILVR